MSDASGHGGHWPPPHVTPHVTFKRELISDAPGREGLHESPVVSSPRDPHVTVLESLCKTHLAVKGGSKAEWPPPHLVRYIAPAF